MYNERDPVTFAKAITTYAKNNPLFVFKAGMVEGRVVNLADFDQIASLPSKEELISKLMFLLNSQAQRIATAVSAVSRNLAVVLNQASEQKKFSGVIGRLYGLKSNIIEEDAECLTKCKRYWMRLRS